MAYLIVYCEFDLLFAIAQGTLPWEPILASKFGKSAYSPLSVARAFGNRLQYHTSGFKRFICDDLATSCKHLVNYGSVTLEFNGMKGVHPSSISSLATFALLLDLAGTSTEFSGAITTQFGFTYTIKVVSAMPHGLHAGFCHAFLVL